MSSEGISVRQRLSIKTRTSPTEPYFAWQRQENSTSLFTRKGENGKACNEDAK
jgi:hypothetical protein